MKIALIKFISVLFLGLLFVLPIATEAKSSCSEFSEGDCNLPYNFVAFADQDTSAGTDELEEKEMILFVTINDIKVTNNGIVVSKGDWVRVKASVFSGQDEETVEFFTADKIICQIRNSKGKKIYYKESPISHEWSFALKAEREGWFYVKVIARKMGYKTVSFRTKFKVK